MKDKTGRISSKILILIQGVLAVGLIILGYYCEENVYGSGYIDGFFSVIMLVPGLCTLVQLFFYLAYRKFPTKAYFAAYSFLLNFALANTFDCLVFSYFHFPINWVNQIPRCIIVALVIGIVNGSIAFLYVLLKGKAGKIVLGPNETVEL